MRSTVSYVRSTRNGERLRKSCSGNPVQVDGTLNGTPLNGAVRARYDVDPGDTIEAVVCALLLVPMSIRCVVIIGALRAMGAR